MNWALKTEKHSGHGEAEAMEQESRGLRVATEERPRAETGLRSPEERVGDKSQER